MTIKDLIPVEWSNKRVLLTAQLAHFYGCEPRHISDNFKRNESRFKVNKHFFKIEGADLAALRLQVTESGLQNLHSDESGLQISSKTRTLYLWTERGAARHAKMLSTDKAWEVFEELEDCYFSQKTPEALVAPAATKPLPNPNRRAGQLSDARVYVLEMEDGTVQIVKIGQSKNIRSRTAKIKRDTGLTVKNIYFTPFMSREDARLIEWACQEIFSSRRVRGEFFSVKFEEVCTAMDYFVKLASVPSIVSNFERVEKVLAIASMMSDSSEKKQALISSAKLIAGK